MRTALLAALLGTTAFMVAAVAQQQPQVTPTIAPQGTVEATAALAECDRLIAYLEQAKLANPGVTVEQVRAWRQASEFQRCQDNLRRLTENASATSGPQTGPTQTGALPSAGMQAVKASDLAGRELYNARGEKMGKVEEVVIGADNKAYIVVGHGGFLGLGQKQVALSTDQIAMRGDRLVAESLTDEHIRALPEYKESANFKVMDGNQTTNLRLVQ